MASAPADTPQQLRPAAPRTRPRELEDGLNFHVYHPLSGRLARALVPTGVSPNAVSVLGGLLICAAAYFYTQVAWPAGALIGFACHLLWHVVDGADGDLARMTGKASPTGEIIDGICDYAGHVVLYVALAAMLAESIGGWAWAWGWAAGLSHVVQTNHAESQRRHGFIQRRRNRIVLAKTRDQAEDEVNQQCDHQKEDQVPFVDDGARLPHLHGKEQGNAHDRASGDRAK